MSERDGDSKLGESMQKIGRSAERIDNPDIIVAGVQTTLLGKNGVTGECLADHLDDRLFSHRIDFAGKIISAFLIDMKGSHTIDGANNLIARTSSSAHGNIEHWMHDVGIGSSV